MQVMPFIDGKTASIDGRANDHSTGAQDAEVVEDAFAVLLSALATTPGAKTGPNAVSDNPRDTDAPGADSLDSDAGSDDDREDGALAAGMLTAGVLAAAAQAVSLTPPAAAPAVEPIEPDTAGSNPAERGTPMVLPAVMGQSATPGDHGGVTTQTLGTGISIAALGMQPIAAEEWALTGASAIVPPMIGQMPASNGSEPDPLHAAPRIVVFSREDPVTPTQQKASAVSPHASQALDTELLTAEPTPLIVESFATDPLPVQVPTTSPTTSAPANHSEVAIQAGQIAGDGQSGPAEPTPGQVAVPVGGTAQSASPAITSAEASAIVQTTIAPQSDALAAPVIEGLSATVDGDPRSRPARLRQGLSATGASTTAAPSDEVPSVNQSNGSTSANVISGVTQPLLGNDAGTPPAPIPDYPDQLPLESTGEHIVSARPTSAEILQATAAINQSAAVAGPLTPAHSVSREVSMWLHQPMLAQVVRGIEMAAERPGQAVHVRLYPEGLGAMRVEVGMTGTDVHVHMTVDNPGTRDLIQSNWNNLSNTLSDRGLTIAGAQVELSGGNARWGAPGDQPNLWRPTNGHTAAPHVAEDQPESPVRTLNRSSALGVDYRV